MLPDLENLLQYKHERVLSLYEQNYPNNKLPAKQAFEEVLKYLWLSKKHELDLKDKKNKTIPSECFMPRSMREIDEMWHEFILFTQDYCDFCNTYFGEYIHHLPNVFDNRPRIRSDVEEDIEKLISYIYDTLGEDTVRSWFAIYLDEQQNGQSK